jgi:hypothetical protein
MTKAPLVTLQRAFQSDHSLGRRTLNTEPLPGSLLTVMSPPIIWQSATLALIAQKQPIRRHDYYVYFLGVPAAKVPTSFDELRGGTRGRLKLHNFGRTPPRALPDSKRELQRAVADLYRWGAICRSGIELFLMKATWKPWFVCGSRTRNSVKRYEQLYRGAENPALLA